MKTSQKSIVDCTPGSGAIFKTSAVDDLGGEGDNVVVPLYVFLE